MTKLSPKAKAVLAELLDLEDRLEKDAGAWSATVRGVGRVAEAVGARGVAKGAYEAAARSAGHSYINASVAAAGRPAEGFLGRRARATAEAARGQIGTANAGVKRVEKVEAARAAARAKATRATGMGKPIPQPTPTPPANVAAAPNAAAAGGNVQQKTNLADKVKGAPDVTKTAPAAVNPNKATQALGGNPNIVKGGPVNANTAAQPPKAPAGKQGFLGQAQTWARQNQGLAAGGLVGAGVVGGALAFGGRRSN